MLNGLRLRAWVFVTVIVAVGCDSARNGPSADGVRDSAAIQIVESSAPVDDEGAWTVSMEPRVRIGVAEGDDGEMLYRVFSGLVLEDGRILVSNSGSSEIRVYGRDGRLERSFGGAGEGPGEFGPFSSMRLISLAGDTIAVTDEGNRPRRINFFSLSSGYIRTISFLTVPGYGRPSVSGFFADGSWLAVTSVGRGTLEGSPGDLIRQSRAYLKYHALAQQAELIATVAAPPRVVIDRGGGRPGYTFVPLNPGPAFALSGDELIESAGYDPEYRRLDSRGEVRQLVRWSPPRIRVDDIWSRFTDAYLEEVVDEERPGYARMMAMDGLPIPEYVPAIESITVDLLGNVWVERYRLPWDTDRLWDVLNPEGQWLAYVTTPPNVDILEIGTDYLLGRHQDQFGVERVVLHDLTRPGEPPDRE